MGESDSNKELEGLGRVKQRIYELDKKRSENKYQIIQIYQIYIDTLILIGLIDEKKEYGGVRASHSKLNPDDDMKDILNQVKYHDIDYKNLELDHSKKSTA